MAVRYVKDFEFPGAAGFSSSCNTTPSKMAKVPMYAKGGHVKKAEGGYNDSAEYMRELEKRSPIQSGTYGKKKPEPKKKEAPRDIEASDLYDAEQLKRLERGYKKGGKIEYIDKGKDTSVSVQDIKSGKVKQSNDADYYREVEEAKKTKTMKKGGKVHDDEAMDKALIRKMVKPEARKMKDGGKVKKAYADGGPVLATSLPADPRLANKMNRMAAKGMNPAGPLTPPTTGGPLPPTTPSTGGPLPLPTGATSMPSRGGSPAAGGTMGPRPVVKPANVPPTGSRPVQGPAGPRVGQGGPGRMAMKSGGDVKSPLQSMKIGAKAPSMERAKAVPVASRAPMIASPSMEAPTTAKAKIGIGESRPGKPNVGRIRAMMAKAASQAAPENSPAVMKRGGMTKGKC